MKITVALLIIVLASAAQAAEEPQEPVSTETRPCVKNFTAEGSIFKGKAYKTWQEFSGLDYDKVFRQVAQAVAENAWGTVSPNKDAGIITAGQAVTMGKGSVAPLNVVIKERSGGVIRVEAIFGTAAGQSTSKDAARTELCKLVEAPIQ
jgi:hypothetical protein